MPKKAKAVRVGQFKIEDEAIKVVRLANGVVVQLQMSKAKPESIESVNVVNGKAEIKIPAALLVQTGLAVTAIDNGKRFVCANHGSFESNGTQMQRPTCASCHKATVEASTRAINTSGTFEEEDA